ncbi:hypothetical protein [Microbacterium aurantiacum]|uniref:hypothetical protein n=1 Tax=Microbacterium aurantiacum TaxID=162393 RepID=UPI001F1FCF32|nr:hypothetical protein [Microbacterium aurantiacum]
MSIMSEASLDRVDITGSRSAPSHPRMPEAHVERLADDVYVVTLADDAIGFIEVAARIYVASVGPRRDRALECAQTHSLDTAALAIAEIHGTTVADAATTRARRVTRALYRPLPC